MSMFVVYVCSIYVINIMFPERKGTIIGLMYGVNTAGVAVISPVVTILSESFSIGTAIMLQGAAVTLIVLIGVTLIKIPEGMKEAAFEENLPEEAEEDDKSAVKFGMDWKKLFRHPSFYLLLLMAILVQMIGNVLASDAAYMAETTLGITTVQASFVVSVFSIGAIFGGILVGYMADKIGPFKATAFTSLFNALVLLLVGLFGMNSYALFATSVAVQGLTYNGVSAVLAVIVTESYGAKNLGINMGIVGIGQMIVGVLGPQFGLMFPAGTVFVCCAGFSALGAVFAFLTRNSVNGYYKRLVVR